MGDYRQTQARVAKDSTTHVSNSPVFIPYEAWATGLRRTMTIVASNDASKERLRCYLFSLSLYHIQGAWALEKATDLHHKPGERA